MNMINRRTFLKATGAGLAAISARANPLRTGKKPNTVFVLTDQWRAAATGYAGDPNVKTPHIDALATEAVNFKNAVSVCPVCTPYRASLMTGQYPLSTGMFLNDLYLPSEALCMAEIFRTAGYDTGYIGKWHLDGHGRDSFIPKARRQGFDYWKVLECTHDYNNSHYYAGDDQTKRTWTGYDAYAQTRDAQAYIRAHAHRDKPFLLVLAYGAPHFPHASAPDKLKAMYPPETIKLPPNVPQAMQTRARREAQGYYAHCSALDQCVGDLQQTLKDTGISQNTIFVFTSDHGEMLGSQGVAPCEKQRPWDESIRVPFLLRYPAKLGTHGAVIQPPLNTPDILPTLLALSGLPIPETVEGEDLTGLMTQSRSHEDRAALVMTVAPFAGYDQGKAFRGIRTARYTYVRAVEAPWLLYDNETDPYQMKNLVNLPEHAALQQSLEAQLQARLRAVGDPFKPKSHYLTEWGYELDRRGCIPYHRNAPVQGPGLKKRPS